MTNIHATIGDFAFGAVDARATDRAFIWHLELFSGAVLDEFQNVRNYFCRRADENGVAGVDIEALDFVHIVESDFETVTPLICTGSESRTGDNAGAADADGDFAKESGF
jgi:hypothetical protein